MAETRRGPTVGAMRQLLALAVLALAVAAAGCGGSHRGTPVVVDTDLSTDDAVALLYLADNPRVDVGAVTVSGTGLVHCPDGARIALDLLALAGRHDVPVACGSSVPLGGANAVPDGWRQAADGVFGLTLPRSSANPDASAVALLRRTGPGSTVVELAPMTNLAEAFRADPGLADKVQRVVAMGGAVGVPGNVAEQPVAETNVWLDPAAARVVARSGVPLTLVPLDATNGVPITAYFAQALARHHYATPEATFVWELMQSAGLDRGGQYFWDPLAASVVVDRSLVRTVDRRLEIADDGRTVVTPGGPTAVALAADRTRFERQLLSTLLHGKTVAIPPARPDATVTLTAAGCRYQGAKDLTAGPLVLDTVNRTSTPFAWAIGHLDGRHTLADLRRYAARLKGPVTPPAWFTADAGGGPVPPHARTTWRAAASLSPTGSAIFVCATQSPTRVWLAAELPVFGTT